jgi:phage repressor protein C with HTH and peptisase S24 domain
VNLGAVARHVRDGWSVRVKASGKSMTPRIKNGETVTVSPLQGAPEKGQVVLARVNGRWYLHLVSATRPGQVQISNNHGHVNGWTSIANVVGLVDK